MLSQLIEQCRRGNAFAQRRLYDLYESRLYRISLRYVQNEPVAEEVMMNAFLKMFRSLETFTYRDENSFEAWLRRIVVNEALQYLRTNRRLPLFRDDDEVTVNVPEQTLPDGELEAEQIYALVRALPTGYRTVFNLYAIEGYTHQEIARQLNISENTSKSQLSKARALLQSWLTIQGYEQYARRTS